MARELLIEIGCEELPAAWLPELTGQLAAVVRDALRDIRLDAGEVVEAFATPRRLTARVGNVLERQPDDEETVTGPPVSAAFDDAGAPTRAAEGFARKHDVAVQDLDRVETPKGEYLAVQLTHRGRTAVDVLPGVLTQTLRGLSFPKNMRWDARLDDGRGELLFGRPIRWLLFLYRGRVVPYTIERSLAVASDHVAEVVSAGVTYGHRFLATSGRPGRALRVKSFEEYRSKLAEHFVVLDRRERRERIARELESHARRLGGRVTLQGRSQSALLDEVPDLVEYPSVIGGTFDPAFLDLPDEVLTTAMIHHQHYFPVTDGEGRLKPAFLAVTNADADDTRTIAGNSERVLAARLRDAQFFWEADRAQPLEDKRERLDTLLLHAKLGSYADKASRLEALAGWTATTIDQEDHSAHAARAAGLAKIDLTTDMVREFTELQGTMGGIYARADGEPEPVWKAIYHQYQPQGVLADEPPSAEDLGAAAGAWAALAVADRVDSLVGLHAAGERPRGTRDPFGMRRMAQGLMRTLVDLPELTGAAATPAIGELVERAASGLRRAVSDDEEAVARLAGAGLDPLYQFLLDRLRHLFQARGVAHDAVKAVFRSFEGRPAAVRPLDMRRRLEGLAEVRGSEDLQALAVLFKRVKNIARELSPDDLATARAEGDGTAALSEPAERELSAALVACAPAVRQATDDGDYASALVAAAALRPPVDRFFTEVFVMVDDTALRRARLRLMADLRDLVLALADISELVPSTES